MHRLYPFAFMALINATTVAAKEPMPTAAELSAAIAVETKRPVFSSDVRPIKCKGFVEEPTEFECSWKQKVGGRWLRYSTYFAIDGNGWKIIDWPPSKSR